MSVESIVKALHVFGLDPAEKLLLVGIANHDGDNGSWPSIETLTGYLGRSDRTVQRYISHLVELGYVTVEHNAGGTDFTRNDKRPNRYWLHLPPVEKVPHGVTPLSPRGDHGVTKGVSRGDKPGGHGVTQLCHPKRHLETHLEPRSANVVAVDNFDRVCLACHGPIEPERIDKTRCASCQADIDARRLAREAQEGATA